MEVYEFEFNYQPTRNLFATFGYSYTDASRTAGFFASPYTADRADETGGVYVSPLFRGPPGGEVVDAPGVPDHLFNGLLSYKWANGFGVTAGILFWEGMKSGYDGFEFSVPNWNTRPICVASEHELGSQYEVDFGFTSSWKIGTAVVLNVTDEETGTSTIVYGNDQYWPVSRLGMSFLSGGPFKYNNS